MNRPIDLFTFVYVVLLTIVMILALAALRRFFPPEAVEAHEPFSADERARFEKWLIAEIPAGVTTAAFLTFVYYLLFSVLGRIAAGMRGESAYLIVAPRAMWLAISIFAGIITAPLVWNAVLHLALRERYDRFSRFSALKHGFSGGKAFVFLGAVIGILVLVLSALGMKYYVQFNEDEIFLSRLFDLGESRYLYTQVTSIQLVTHRRAPIGTTVESPRYVLRFGDGSSWETSDDGRSPDPVLDREIMEFVSSRSGKGIVTVKFLEEP